MLDGSCDIPALKFFICVMDESYFNILKDGRFFDIDWNRLVTYEFEQVDGLTLSQFYSIFCGYDRSKKLAIVASVINTPYFKHMTSIGFSPVWTTLLSEVYDTKDYHRELSEYIEQQLLKLCASKEKVSIVSFYDVVATFCARYRGRDAKFIAENVRRREIRG